MLQHVVLLLLGAHLASAETHSLRYFYTGVSGISDFPEFTAVGLVDDQQFYYFDSNIMKAVPKTDWIRENEGEDYWDRQTQNMIGTHQSFKNNIQVVKERFNQTTGVHTIQRMYGCEFDDQTGATNAFSKDGYDGEDFLSLHLKEMIYISPVSQGFITTIKWNSDRGMIESRKQYLSTFCIEWLKKYLQYGQSSLKKTVSPQVSLLQKSSSSPVSCHATGFYPSGVTITWMRNGEEHHEDVDLGELLPNEDGTFQKTSTLTVTPEELKNNKYSCVVEHQGKTKLADEIRTNLGDSVPIGIIVGVVVAAVLLLIVIGVIGYMVIQKKEKLSIQKTSSTDSAKSLLSFSSSSVESTKDPENLNSDSDHGYNSSSDNNTSDGSHIGSDNGSDSGSVCSDNSFKEMRRRNEMRKLYTERGKTLTEET